MGSYRPSDELFKFVQNYGNGTDVGNTDNRGGGCGNLHIPLSEFKWDCTNPSGINIKDIAEGVYRMKGSKYDWWYEMFSDNSKYIIKNDTVHFEIDFDYGS